MTTLLLVVAAITSTFAVVLAARRGIGGVRAALGTVLEVVGATVVFLAANSVVGATLILAARRLSPFYTTLHDVTDVTLVIISLAQALTLTAWRQSRS
jgi:hypothetical protein